MELPRFRIASLMVAVAIAGLNFGAIRAMLAPGMGLRGASLVVGALPMANVLVAGLLVARQRPKSRPFLLRFEAFGAIALALYVVLVASSLHREVVMPYVQRVLDPINQRMATSTPLVLIPVRFSVGVVLLVMPQMAFALIGGFVSRKFSSAIRMTELAIPAKAHDDPRSVEVARIWVAGGCQHVSLKVGQWSDPAAWGIILVDLARHVASAHQQMEGRDPDDTLAKIKEGFDVEWDYPTDAVTGGVISNDSKRPIYR
jgi:hypothetical protein